MKFNFDTIIKYAWTAYDSSRSIVQIDDISARVSTNHVYKVTFSNKSFVIAKLSYFGQYEHFVEDHRIINVLANNLPDPFENFLARSLMKVNSLFVHRFINEDTDAWVVFYRPIKIKTRLPNRLEDPRIVRLAKEFARFHTACHSIRHTLPSSSKTMQSDIDRLREELDRGSTRFGNSAHQEELKRQCDLFYKNTSALQFNRMDKIPIFVDWNIGNFSVTPTFRLFSRWDYDWFRMSTRMLDFYFFSRIVSNVGDRTVFTYNIGTMMEDRFILFLKTYHERYPFTENEIRGLREVYRFFLLHYVMEFGAYFFAESYAKKLQQEALEIHFPSIETGFDPEVLLKALNI
jgi:hypothetical protein